MTPPKSNTANTIISLQTKNRELQIRIDKLQNKILKLENKAVKQEQKILKLRAENIRLKERPSLSELAIKLDKKLAHKIS